MVGGAQLQKYKILYLLGGQPTSWKIIISQMLSHRSESLKPHIRLPSLRVWHWKEEPPEQLVSGIWSQKFHRNGGNKTPLLEGACKVSWEQDKGEKTSDLIGAWARPTCWCWRVFCRGWGRSWFTARTHTGGSSSREYSLASALLEAAVFLPSSGYFEQPVGSSSGTPQAKQLTGWEHSTSTSRQAAWSLPKPTASH